MRRYFDILFIFHLRNLDLSTEWIRTWTSFKILLHTLKASLHNAKCTFGCSLHLHYSIPFIRPFYLRGSAVLSIVIPHLIIPSLHRTHQITFAYICLDLPVALNHLHVTWHGITSYHPCPLEPLPRISSAQLTSHHIALWLRHFISFHIISHYRPSSPVTIIIPSSTFFLSHQQRMRQYDAA